MLKVLDDFGRNPVFRTERNEYYLLKCLTNWLSFYTDGIIMKSISTHSVFLLALESLSKSELNEKASQCLCIVIEEMNLERDADLSSLLAKKVFDYISECDRVIEENMDEDFAGYLKVFIEFGMKSFPVFVYTRDQASLTFLMYLLKLFEKTDLEGNHRACDFLNKQVWTI